MIIKSKFKVFKLFALCCLLFALCACTPPADEIQYDTQTIVHSVVIDENSVPIFPKKAALTTDAARRFAIDLPKRCGVNWGRQEVVSVVPSEHIQIVRLDTGDPLPEFAVSDYEKLPI